MTIETLYALPLGGEGRRTWWEEYSANLRGLSPTALEVLAADCSYIVDRGVLGAGDAGDSRWPATRVRRGLVVGSVQSGKTASMFGVAAMALDAKIDIVVLLAGTRTSLWRQTYARFCSQLDRPSGEILSQTRRILAPATKEVVDSDSRAPLSSLYNLEPAQIRRAIREQRPIVFVAMKQTDHLRALGKVLRDVVYPAVGDSTRDCHMLVLDDEADDGSILDAAIETTEDPIFGRLKQIPRAIADLWGTRVQAGSTQNLYTTYVSYTATPQANLLQENHNPLFPEHFIAALRTPYDRGNVAPRETTYFEPAGLSRMYIGGEVYYRRLASASLCLPASDSPADDLARSVRAYLVARAITLYRASPEHGLCSARDTTFPSDESARLGCPSPSSMLIHPSPAINDHFSVARQLLEWSGHSPEEAMVPDPSSSMLILSAALGETLDSDPAAWSEWLDAYRASATCIGFEFNVSQEPTFPSWTELRDILRHDVIPGTRVSVINSDPMADDRPDYEPHQVDDGWRAPRDLSTIFISGNVMSRGLTLEGLTTTLFYRHSDQPFADTQMQMQRWFGYRGEYLDLCRIIAPKQQLQLFASYHDGDEALRQTIIQLMHAETPETPTPHVLQGDSFVATGKIANLGSIPLCPGPKPFIRFINSGEQEDQNTVLAASVFDRAASSTVVGGGRVRGRILDSPISLDQAADLIGALRFEQYSPGQDSWQAGLWRDIQSRVSVLGTLPADSGLYQPTEPTPGVQPSVARSDCPYSISAYLRLWSACLTRHVRGLVPTDQPMTPWAMEDLDQKRATQPKFWVGIRYGSGPSPQTGPLGALTFAIPVMDRSVENGKLVASWGSRNPEAANTGYRGDEYFDYYHRGESVPAPVQDGPQWRGRGSDGLILFHINQPNGQLFPTTAVGVCIPAGGPDQFAAYTNHHQS